MFFHDRKVTSMPHWLRTTFSGGEGVLTVMSWLLLVGLLLVGVARSVLDVGRARAQPVQVATVLCIIDMILKKHLGGNKQRSLGGGRNPVTQSFENICPFLFYPGGCLRHTQHVHVNSIETPPTHTHTFIRRAWKPTSLILKKAIPVRRESEPAWCWGPILSSSSCSATSCRPPCQSNPHLSITPTRTRKPVSQQGLISQHADENIILGTVCFLRRLRLTFSKQGVYLWHL